ncbi:uncharacterized protein PHA67_021040 [Liasis olivaceus]
MAVQQGKALLRRAPASRTPPRGPHVRRSATNGRPKQPPLYLRSGTRLVTEGAEPRDAQLGEKWRHRSPGSHDPAEFRGALRAVSPSFERFSGGLGSPENSLSGGGAEGSCLLSASHCRDVPQMGRRLKAAALGKGHGAAPPRPWGALSHSLLLPRISPTPPALCSPFRSLLKRDEPQHAVAFPARSGSGTAALPRGQRDGWGGGRGRGRGRGRKGSGRSNLLLRLPNLRVTPQENCGRLFRAVQRLKHQIPAFASSRSIHQISFHPHEHVVGRLS